MGLPPYPCDVPVQSVELLLRPSDEDRIGAEWQALLQAGLPSQARHTAPSNRPHTTLVAVARIDDDVEAALASLPTQLPLPARWGPVTRFGREPWTVVRLVEPSEALRAFQSEVAGICRVPDGDLSHPDRWTAHVTLARRVTAADLPRVVALVETLAEQQTPVGSSLAFSAVRRWDGARRREWPLAGATGTRSPGAGRRVPRPARRLRIRRPWPR